MVQQSGQPKDEDMDQVRPTGFQINKDPKTSSIEIT